MELFRRFGKVVSSRLPHRKEPGAEPGYRKTDATTDEGPLGGGPGPDRSGAETGAALAGGLDLRHCYANLEIPYGSDLKAAKTAWRRLMKRYHPDLHGKDPRKREIATELTRKLTEAYRQIERSFQ
jgi:DnaJ-domain-containing protein 1